METTRQRSGRLAEDAVLTAARARKLKLIERNYSTRYGELDLIVSDGKTLIIVEVRYRARSDYGLAVESVTLAKQKRIIAATQGYLAAHAKWRNAPVRFDVVGVDGQGQLNWIEQAFLGEY